MVHLPSRHTTFIYTKRRRPTILDSDGHLKSGRWCCIRYRFTLALYNDVDTPLIQNVFGLGFRPTFEIQAMLCLGGSALRNGIMKKTTGIDSVVLHALQRSRSKTRDYRRTDSNQWLITCNFPLVRLIQPNYSHCKAVKFLIGPYIRFKGKTGEQVTMFFLDHAGYPLGFRPFGEMGQLFAK